MRRIRYCVASSLDGYIAGPKGEADWIIMDPDIDFEAIFNQFDTFLMGRRTYEGMPKGGNADPHVRTLVFSRTLRQQDHRDVTIVADRADEILTELRAQPGKDIWLFGGGSLFSSLLAIGQVDAVEVAIIPVLLGGGIPLLPAPAVRRTLSLKGQRVYHTGIVSLEYDVNNSAAKMKSGKKTARSR